MKIKIYRISFIWLFIIFVISGVGYGNKIKSNIIKKVSLNLYEEINLSHPSIAHTTHHKPLEIKEIDNLSLDSSQIVINGIASWYSRKDRGIRKTTANMEIFDDTKFTCAMWGVPFGSLVKVTNLKNGKSVVVRVNDRGPAGWLVRQGRVIDLTKEAFSHIASLKEGLVEVNITIISINI
ncbi:MAG: septal ring lytic transglycosylase RlpA family protein [Candidatus Omnitrophica bacterium]|nr:septal ring lytic transglycosylase RlpA family protein [Candidatus Omnitrophota bacterium]MCM8827152.1 septal ring lytic transglycosylase RlpA family protein [Candidatus Omnitrophota bacterium]